MHESKNERQQRQDDERLAAPYSATWKSAGPIGPPVAVEYASPVVSKQQNHGESCFLSTLALFGGVAWGAIATPSAFGVFHIDRLGEQSFMRCVYGASIAVAVLFVVAATMLTRTGIFKSFIIGLLIGCGFGLLICGVCGSRR